MEQLSDRLARLSPDQRKLLSLLLEQEAAHRRRAPASFAQARLWFLDQLQPGSAFYNVPLAWQVIGSLDLPTLRRSLHTIVVRHEVLRTSFVEGEDGPLQVIADPRPLPLPVAALNGLDPTARALHARRLADAETQRPFDLACGPLFRALLLRLADTEHILLLTLHHAIADAWSLGIVTSELRALYTAAHLGTPPALPTLPIQYADYALWQHTWLTGARLEQHLAYWQERLTPLPRPLDLPTDRPHPTVQRNRGATSVRLLAPPLAAALKALSLRAGATLFMTLLAAFAALLSRYTQQEDIVVGTPIANRDRAETAPLIGLFVNTLVLRLDLARDPTFAELLGCVRAVCLDAYDHQDLPFDKLVEALRPERDLSRHPLFQVMLMLEHAPVDPFVLPGVEVRPVEVTNMTAKVDLSLVVEEMGAGMAVYAQYSTDLFDDTTIARLLGHLLTLLEGTAAHPERRIGDLPLLTPPEQQLLVEWNATRAEYALEIGLHQLVEAQTRAQPDAVAVVCEDCYLSYGELNRRADQLANLLGQHGVRPEVFVGLYVQRSLEMIVGMFAILKAGGVYVPLDPMLPGERLAFIVADTQPPVLLTMRRLVSDLPPYDAQVICLDTDWAQISRQPAQRPTWNVHAAHTAYVIYTSGSTGRPKGVVIEQRQILNYLWGIRDRLQLTAGASFALVQPLAVDSSKTTIFPALCAGGCLHVIVEERALQPEGFEEYCRQHVVDCLKIAPSHLAALQSGASTERILPRRWLIVGGEVSHPEWVAQLQGQAPGCAIYNHYGPTETTVGVLTFPTAAERWASSGLLPIGRPLPNTQAYILDQRLHAVPIGVPGELYIGGAGLARGYYNRPDLTAERFVPDPFFDHRPPTTPSTELRAGDHRLPTADKETRRQGDKEIGNPDTELVSRSPGLPVSRSSARLYKTGDLARYRPDGAIEYLGRLDGQVKLRGFRIELGEIETLLHQHPDVGEAVVLLREDHPGEQRLVAYVVPASAPAPSWGELRRALALRLPEYMLPSVFVILEELPLTPHGKLDRHALPAPDDARPDLAAGFVAPRTPIEAVLADIWAGVLRVERLGVHDNFFELGGHSLLATQVVSKLRTTLRVEAPLRSLFEAPTVAELAQLLVARETTPGQLARIAHAVQRVAQMSDADIRAALEQHRGTTAGELSATAPPDGSAPAPHVSRRDPF